jgi:hypothetical protein
MSGVCNAVVTFITGSPYGETTLTREVSIMIGNGRADILLDSKAYSADLAAGETLD